MTSAALAWGCGFLAFGPCASLLFLLAYQKAQLVIVVTTSAFAFLLSALFSSMVWWIFDRVGLDLGGVVILLPSVIFQFLMRCGFVSLYHKVEEVIEASIDRHAEQQREEQQRQRRNGANNNNNNNNNTNDGEDSWADSARLRLELNDWSCGLAAGTGFGGMHAFLLFGTLLASESGNYGTLFQESCPGIPSLLLSALNAFFFSILDIAWMLFTFFGMRRRAQEEDEAQISHGFGAMLGSTRRSGTSALFLCFGSHLAASFATTLSMMKNGCVISLPVLGVIAIGTVYAFVGGVSAVYLPLNQRRRLAGDEHTE